MPKTMISVKKRKEITQQVLKTPYNEVLASGRRKVLIVDDNQINREILNGILREYYEIVQAGNGKEALQILESGKEISVILLDIGMPVMNGYEFLEAIQKVPDFISIPIIVTTASNSEADEIRSLEKGASDFISKPYNPDIVLHRVKSIIRLRETSTMLSILKYDQLTGVYSREAFYELASQEMRKNPEKQFTVICSDVKDFKMLNEMYGLETSDKVLCCLADVMLNCKKPGQLCGRIGSDVFSIFFESGDPLTEENIESYIENFAIHSPIPDVVIKFGVYENVDHSLSLSRITSRSLLAMEQIKQTQLHNVAFFREWEKKQLVLNDFETALQEHQFHMFLQPKYDVKNNCVGGAEALVRWFHPKRGLIPPNDFIPLFEEKGFIVQLDFYMWETACSLLHDWKAAGRTLIPISVNMSRMDINTPDLVEKIVKLTEKYDVPNDMLHFEVLERAYTENAQKLIDICKELRRLGYKLEMDDFGTGSSSLNMLSILPIDYLKLDMKFLKTEDDSTKKSILPSIVSLAKWLDLEAIAEGVENEGQVERLKSMGCRYIQGYYFSKPLPVNEFEKYCAEQERKRVLVPENSFDVSTKNKYDLFFKQKKCTILVVEDVEITREILCNMLKPYSSVVQAASGAEALDYMEKNFASIDLVLLDLMLPVMDGFQVVERMKGTGALKNIPIIITSENSRDSELQAIKIGADGFVAKPYRIEILLHYIKIVLLSKGILKNEQV